MWYIYDTKQVQMDADPKQPQGQLNNLTDRLERYQKNDTNRHKNDYKEREESITKMTT